MRNLKFKLSFKIWAEFEQEKKENMPSKGNDKRKGTETTQTCMFMGNRDNRSK
jgi:hypothetical protein